MDHANPSDREGVRKRSPKGFRRACWECKKRKVEKDSSKTDMSSHSSINGVESDRVVSNKASSLHIGERLNKLEQFFERFANRKSSTVSTPPGVSPSSWLEKSEERSIHGLPKCSMDIRNPSSISHTFSRTQTWTSATSNSTLVAGGQDNEQCLTEETIRRALVALLPSQHDADIIFESSNGWMVLNSVYTASQDLYVNGDEQSYALDMEAVARKPCSILARTLLHLAVCIISLPPDFDDSRLPKLRPLEDTTHMYIGAVTSLVTCSDEQMLTIHGLEMLMLLVLYHMHSGRLRQAWLITRRGLGLAHLMGLHRIIAQPDLRPPIPGVSSTKEIYRKFVDVDRYLGLHLRLPFGSEDYPVFEDTPIHVIYRSKVNAISRQIVDLDCDITPQSYARALVLDEELESVVKGVPKDFWDVPNLSSTARSPECFAVLEKLMVQFWHFEMKIFIHLPYLLRTPQDSRYAYSKCTALQASRNIVMRWFALRSANITQACCRFAEVSVFIAAVTLALDIVIELGTREKSEVQKAKGPDFGMICRLIGELEQLARESELEKTAARSANVLKKILSSLDPSRQPAGKSRLTMPYFGTVELEFRKMPVRPGFDLESDTGKAMNKGQALPAFSFVSNALWPSVEGDGGLDWDVVLFDGLEDRDVAGNWVF